MVFGPPNPDTPPKALTIEGNGVFRDVRTPAHVRIPEVFTGLDHSLIAVEAIWDTGATNTVIDDQLAASMKLPPTGQTIVNHARGSEQANTYIVDILLPMGVGFKEVQVTEGKLGTCGLLIGMDIIAAGDFSLTRKGPESWFSFRLPPTGQGIDYVVQIDNQKAKAAAKQQFWKGPKDFKKKKGKKR